MTNIPIGSLDPTLIINCWDEQFQDLIMKTVQELNEFMEMLDIPEKILVNFDTTNYDYPNVKRMFLKFQDSAFMIESSKNDIYIYIFMLTINIMYKPDRYK